MRRGSPAPTALPPISTSLHPRIFPPPGPLGQNAFLHLPRTRVLNTRPPSASPSFSPPGRTGTPSVVVRLGCWIAAIASLAALSIIISIIIADLSSGEARAINMAGSLRMHSYAIQSTVGLDEGESPAPRLEQALAEFERRYAHPDLLKAIPTTETHPIRQAYREIGTEWREHYRPAVLRCAPDAAARRALQGDTARIVSRIDRLVALVEEGLETKLQWLRLIQGISLGLLLVLGASAVLQLKRHVLRPLGELLASARIVQRGNFDVRIPRREPDELGQLGEAFNFMVEDLSRIYGELEDRVQEKTEALARSNRSLQLLYRTTHALSEKAVTRDTLLQVLKDVEALIGLRAGALCLGRSGLTVNTGQPGDASRLQALCESSCVGCGDDDIPLTSVQVGHAGPGERSLSVPLFDGTRNHGAMLLLQADAEPLEAWQLELLQAVGRHIGSALAALHRDEERHRLALLDERSVIARELHDSLAQSLSYLKIQVTRLQSLLGRNPPPERVNEVVQELRDGLSEAYRQLRELLTTFRLRIDGRGLPAAIEETVQEFRRRTGLEISLDNRLSSLDMPPDREIHVLQIIREALSNIERHARATQVRIALENLPDTTMLVTIDDNGIGFDAQATPIHRYGIVIMRDRAQSLKGELQVRPRPEGGTRVELVFPGQAGAISPPHPATTHTPASGSIP